MQVKYYTDENVDHAVCKGLLLRNIDVLTCQEAGMMGASDEEQLAYATQLNRVLFTHDEDFFGIHASGVSHAGIVFSN